MGKQITFAFVNVGLQAGRGKLRRAAQKVNVANLLGWQGYRQVYNPATGQNQSVELHLDPNYLPIHKEQFEQLQPTVYAAVELNNIEELYYITNNAPGKYEFIDDPGGTHQGVFIAQDQNITYNGYEEIPSEVIGDPLHVRPTKHFKLQIDQKPLALGLAHYHAKSPTTREKQSKEAMHFFYGRKIQGDEVVVLKDANWWNFHETDSFIPFKPFDSDRSAYEFWAKEFIDAGCGKPKTASFMCLDHVVRMDYIFSTIQNGSFQVVYERGFHNDHHPIAYTVPRSVFR